MPTRRFLLGGAGGGVVTVLAGIAVARPRHHQRHPASAGEGQPSAASPPASPADTPAGPFDTRARWAFIIDATTGTVLLQKAADEPMPPSSLTKLMTAYLVFSALSQGRLRLDQTLLVSERAWRMQGSKMFVPLGQEVPVSDLIRGMLIQSGNDACIVLAEGIAGSEEQFVVRMNQEAERLGLRQTVFRNATGWPDPDHHMSARDIATLAARLIREFPQYYHFFSEKDYKFNNIDQNNRNELVDKGLADGLKTGHTETGGFGLCVSAERDGHRIIEVLNGLPTARARTEEGERLLAWAFSNFDLVHLFQAGETVQSIPVWLGREPVVAAAPHDDILLTLPRGWQDHTRVRVEFTAPIAAPVTRGQLIAHLTVTGTGAGDLDVPLYATADVPRLPLPKRAIAVIENAIGGS